VSTAPDTAQATRTGIARMLPALLVLAALALFVFVSRPLIQQQLRIERELAQRSAALASMQRSFMPVQQRDDAVRMAGVDAARGSVLAVVERSAHAASIAITRMQPEGEGAVRIRLERVAFDALVGWLAALDDAHALHAHALHLERLDEPGLVRGDLLLGGGTVR
jgi:general secretion pathway protein M